MIDCRLFIINVGFIKGGFVVRFAVSALGLSGMKGGCAGLGFRLSGLFDRFGGSGGRLRVD